MVPAQLINSSRLQTIPEAVAEDGVAAAEVEAKEHGTREVAKEVVLPVVASLKEVSNRIRNKRARSRLQQNQKATHYEVLVQKTCAIIASSMDTSPEIVLRPSTTRIRSPSKELKR